jgi:hypothetical protein
MQLSRKLTKTNIQVYRLPDNANGLEECNVHEADGGGIVVNQVEPVDPALLIHIHYKNNNNQIKLYNPLQSTLQSCVVSH